MDAQQERDTWRLVIELHRLVADHLAATCAEFGLSPGQAQALRALIPGGATPMGELARAISCDPSTITSIADRLESQGLVERQPSASDRRVTTLRLTRKGSRLRSRLGRRLDQVPPALARLSEAKRRALASALRDTLRDR